MQIVLGDIVYYKGSMQDCHGLYEVIGYPQPKPGIPWDVTPRVYALRSLEADDLALFNVHPASITLVATSTLPA